MIWKYGTYEWDWQREKPTNDKFLKWKKDFFSLSGIENYEVWLSGGFLEEWDTWDIDITLLGPFNKKIIQSLLYHGTDIGIKKYNMFVDITYQITPNKIQKFCDNMSPKFVQKIALGNSLKQNNKTISSNKFGRNINSKLSVRYDIYPKEKHLSRIYKHEPVQIV